MELFSPLWPIGRVVTRRGDPHSGVAAQAEPLSRVTRFTPLPLASGVGGVSQTIVGGVDAHDTPGASMAAEAGAVGVTGPTVFSVGSGGHGVLLFEPHRVVQDAEATRGHQLALGIMGPKLLGALSPVARGAAQ